MVFTRHGLTYEKSEPAVQTPNGKENPESVNLVKSRLRRNKYGKLVTPANSWIVRIGTEHHLLPRTKVSELSTVADTVGLANSEIFNIGDSLILHQPHTVLDITGVAGGTAITLAVDTYGDSLTLDAVSGVLPGVQIVEFINNSPILSQKIYALEGPTGSDTVHIFSNNFNSFAITGTGLVVQDAQMVGHRPIGDILTVGTDQNPATYDLVTITPSTDPLAIAATDLPLGAVIDVPIYHEMMGLFDVSLNMEYVNQINIAPVKGTCGMYIPFLSHYDETLKIDFPKINFRYG